METLLTGADLAGMASEMVAQQPQSNHPKIANVVTTENM